MRPSAGEGEDAGGRYPAFSEKSRHDRAVTGLYAPNRRFPDGIRRACPCAWLGTKARIGTENGFQDRRGFIMAGKDRPAMSAAASGRKSRGRLPASAKQKNIRCAQRFSRRKYEIYGNAI